MLPLAFCSNLLPAETLSEVRQQLPVFGEAIREQLGWRRLGRRPACFQCNGANDGG